MSDTSEEHHQLAHSAEPIRIAIVTVSDSRTAESDVNGQFLRERAEALGHLVVGYRIVPDEPPRITRALQELVQDKAMVLLFNGGTGIARRDTTYDVLSAALEREMPGFGELFRMLSFAEIGAPAMLSRATAGTYEGALVFSMPGSPAAVRLAWTKLIEPELEHLVWQVTK